MKLYFIHCGFYDEENLPIMASDIEEAKKKVRAVPQFVAKKIHIDGIQEIESVEGHSIFFKV